MKEVKSCCRPEKKDKPKGFWPGLIYGLLPHSFCIAFVIFSVIGATTATTIFRKFLMVPYFFHLLVGLSFVFATISAVIYLKRNDCLSNEGIKGKWRYLLVLYGTTVGVNLLLFLVIFPMTANLGSRNGVAAVSESQDLTTATLKVAIPCSGHAPLIIDELKKVPGVGGVKFSFPNLFEVKYDSSKVKFEQLLSLEIFKTYRAEFRP